MIYFAFGLFIIFCIWLVYSTWKETDLDSFAQLISENQRQAELKFKNDLAAMFDRDDQSDSNSKPSDR